MDPATRILLTLDRHLSADAEIRLMGGAAMILAYGMPRSTEDVDLLQDDDELRFLAEERDFGPALGCRTARGRTFASAGQICYLRVHEWHGRHR